MQTKNDLRFIFIHFTPSDFNSIFFDCSPVGALRAAPTDTTGRCVGDNKMSSARKTADMFGDDDDDGQAHDQDDVATAADAADDQPTRENSDDDNDDAGGGEDERDDEQESGAKQAVSSLLTARAKRRNSSVSVPILSLASSRR